MNHPELRDMIESLVYPETQETFAQLGLIANLEQDPEGKIRLTLDLPSPAIDRDQQLRDLILEAVGKPVEVTFLRNQAATPKGLGSNLLSEAKNIIAVASGKGGVGKSTVACNLAAALNTFGLKAAVMDADIYGPSQPLLLGVEKEQVKVRDKRILPVEAHGIKLMSMGFLMKPGESVIWRGPMLHGMMQQFCRDVEWGPTDFLIIDLPPGTGDVSLSLSQTVEITGAVVVSTPQDLALDVATKAVGMFTKLGVPILGMVENMSYYCCPECGARDDIFAHGGADLAAANLGLPVLGRIPLNSSLRKAGDAGCPVVLHEPDSPPAKALFELARRIAETVSLQARQSELELAGSSA